MKTQPDIQIDLQQARAELDRLVAAGLDTRAQRGAVVVLQRQLAAHQKAAAEAVQQQQAEAAAAVAAAGAQLAQTTTEAVAAAVELVAPVPADVTLPAVAPDPAVLTASHSLAQARARLVDVEAERDALGTEASRLEALVASKRADLAAMHARRGTSDQLEGDAAEMFALGLDINDLEPIAAAARARVQAVDLATAQDAVSLAASALQQAHGRAEHAAALARVRVLEGALLAAVDVLLKAGSKIGRRSVGANYTADTRLRPLVYGIV